MRASPASKKQKKKPRPTVSLDEACQKCGEPIYYNYRGPIEGICGKCADRSLSRRPARERTRTLVVEERESRTWIWVTVGLAFAAGAVAGYLAHGLLPL